MFSHFITSISDRVLARVFEHVFPQDARASWYGYFLDAQEPGFRVRISAILRQEYFISILSGADVTIVAHFQTFAQYIL